MDILSDCYISSSDSSFSRLLLLVRYHQQDEMLDYVPMQVKMDPFTWIATIKLCQDFVKYFGIVLKFAVQIFCLEMLHFGM